MIWGRSPGFCPTWGPADNIVAQPGAIGSRAASVMYHNLQLRYAPTRSLDVSFGVENLFDKKGALHSEQPKRQH